MGQRIQLDAPGAGLEEGGCGALAVAEKSVQGRQGQQQTRAVRVLLERHC